MGLTVRIPFCIRHFATAQIALLLPLNGCSVARQVHHVRVLQLPPRHFVPFLRHHLFYTGDCRENVNEDIIQEPQHSISVKRRWGAHRDRSRSAASGLPGSRPEIKLPSTIYSEERFKRRRVGRCAGTSSPRKTSGPLKHLPLVPLLVRQTRRTQQ